MDHSRPARGKWGATNNGRNTLTKTYKVGVAAERVVEVEAKNSHEAIGAALEQMDAEGRTVLGTLRVERVEKVTTP